MHVLVDSCTAESDHSTPLDHSTLDLDAVGICEHDDMITPAPARRSQTVKQHRVRRSSLSAIVSPFVQVSGAVSLDESSTIPQFKRRHSIATEMRYPMYVMKVASFLERYSAGERLLESHQRLRKLGLVQECPNSDDDVLFISHEWVGFHHCDPNGRQLRELCLFLRRLAGGEIACVESAWEMQLVYGGAAGGAVDRAGVEVADLDAVDKERAWRRVHATE